MDRATQLRERDIRNGVPDTNPVDFLRRYLASNFADTMSQPSQMQKQSLMGTQEPQDSLKYMQKPRQGTTYDNPGGF